MYPRAYERQLANPNGVDVSHLADHPLLQADAYDWAVTSLSKADAKGMDREYLFGTEEGAVVSLHPESLGTGDEGELAA